MRKYMFIILPLLLCAVAGAQPIPRSDGFRTGKLENGMTYYLYHNENPKGCADFYIAHNVGALQEEDNQNGLAHFLEHLAFNGLKHYPGKDMLNFLAKEGVRFGYNVNAFTSRKETVYNISSVPLVRESFVDSVMLILHDWSCDILCDQQAIDEERGVINEEWRLRDEPRYRMMCRQGELVYKGGKQPERTVLGSMDVILNFKREEILDFYHKWYRPDLQAIIITGDIDVDSMEEKIKAKFSDISMPENAPEKPLSYMPPRQNGPLFANMTDPTIRYECIKIIYKQPYFSADNGWNCNNEQFYRDYYAREIISSILMDRMRIKCKEKNSPVQSAVANTSDSNPEFYVTLLTISPRTKKNMAGSFEECYREVRRLLEHGISEREFEVAKLNVLQREHLEKDIHPQDVKTDQISKICYRNFLDGTPLINPVDRNALMKKILEELTYQFVSTYPVKMFEESEVIYSNCVNEKELDVAVPFEQMRQIIKKVNSEKIEAGFIQYPELDLNVKSETGSIARRKNMGEVKCWTLSNGARVYFRPSKPYKNDDHLAIKIEFDGGFRCFPADKITSSKYAAAYIRRHCGFRGIERSEYRNFPELTGITSIMDIKENYSYIDVRLSGKRNIENAFRFINLQMTEPYFPGEKQLEKEKTSSLREMSKKKNDRQLYDIEARKQYFGNNPWNAQVDSAGIQAVDQSFVDDLFKRCFGDYSSMKIFICSDLPESQIEEYLCRFVASTGRGNATKMAKKHPLLPAFKGEKTFAEVKPAVSEPLTDISYEYIWNDDRTRRTQIEVQILDYILSDRYLNLIREERGGAYHVAFSTDFTFNPKRPISSFVTFQTRPELKEILLQDVKDVMEQMCKEGPTDKEMDTAVKYLKKYHAERESVIANSALLQEDELLDLVKYGIEYKYDYDGLISDITADDIRKLAGYVSSDRCFISVYTEEK